MNKKHLSVVMAGAMLATTVAPVLAETIEVTRVNKGTLITELTDKLWDAPRFSNDKRVASNLKGKSVYAVKVGDQVITSISDKTVKDTNLKSDLQKEIHDRLINLKVGDKVELVNLGYREVTEKDKNLVLSTEVSNSYIEAELMNDDLTDTELSAIGVERVSKTITNANVTNIVNSHGYVSGKGYVIKLVEDAAKAYGEKEIVLTVGSERLDFTKAIKGDGSDNNASSSLAASDFHGFATADAKNVDIADKAEALYEIGADGITFQLSDLFDGVMLTAQGQALVNEAKETRAVLKAKEVTGNEEWIVKTGKHTELGGEIKGLSADKNGVYTLEVEIASADRVAENIKAKQWNRKNDQYKTYYVKATSKAELAKIMKWIDTMSPDVDVLAGEDRYQTAVNIAKEVAGLKDINSSRREIVLVNGSSIVDGLAAAPLANVKGNAPILLTKADELPNATKKYLIELVDKYNNKGITVNIVGGTSVVSKSIEKELKSLNLKVERYAGSNREETSMAVAEAVNKEAHNGKMEKAFVIGAKGEADAMSIAGYAAQTKTPIVVSNFSGLSEDTLEELEGSRVNVIGGEDLVSSSDFAEVKAVALTATRTSGSDRKETNAKVIEKFYTNNFAKVDAVVVAKDGYGNKDQLIDALTASNLASVKNAPIVLGTNSLSVSQKNVIALNAIKHAKKVYQVGEGVDKVNVVKVVAQALGLI